MPQDKEIISQTKSWLEQTVIGHNFCPFAAQPFLQDRIRYWLLQGKNPEEHLEILVREMEYLHAHPEIETSLLILPAALGDFHEYLDFLEIAMALLAEQGYEGVFQLASFHPHYKFAGSEEDDAANFTNRSPYPMLHLLREESVEKAIDSHPDPEAIPERNIAHAQEIGADVFRKILIDLFH